MSNENQAEVPERNPLTYGSVWKVLSAIDCSKHVKKKNNMSYLSWTWAWEIMMKHYPDMLVEHARQVDYDTAGSATVWCKVSIGHLERVMWLPVMTGYKNDAKVQPDARDIGDARMRAMVKCFALFGLGHYIYAGEDLPRTGDEPVVHEHQTQPTPGALVDATQQTPEPVVEDAQSPDAIVAGMKMAVDTFHSETLESLAGFWHTNKATIDWLDTYHPDHYAAIKAHFTAVKAKIMEASQ